MNTLSLRAALGVGIFASCALVVACSSSVKGGGASDMGEGGGEPTGTSSGGGDWSVGPCTSGGPSDVTSTSTGVPSGGGGGAGPGSGAAIAMLHSEIPAPDPTGTSVSTTTGSSGGPDPDSVVLFVGNPSPACDDPFGSGCEVSSFFVSVSIPPALQTPGVYTLEELNGFVSVSEPGGSPGLCSGGGGTYWDGTFEITEIDDGHVAGIFAGTSTSWGFGIDGAVNAPRCF